jgi:DNA-binding response OmpR family regulator
MDMPGLSGAETLVQIRALRPDLPVLICTGRFDPTDQLLVQHYPNVELLHKPIKLADLQARLA